MKKKIIQKIYFLIMLCSILLVIGCDNFQSKSSKSLHIKSDPVALKELEMKIGVNLPPNAIMTDGNDGGGRDPSYDFYIWGLFCPSSIKIPNMNITSAKEYSNSSLENIIEVVQRMMGGMEILQPQFIGESEWKNKNHIYRGTLVRTVKGDYLIIEQFRDK